MRKSKILLISVVLALSIGSAAQLGMINAIGDGAMSFFNGIFPANTDNSGAGNTNGLPSSNYQGSSKVYFDRNLQSQVLKSSFNNLDGGFTTTVQVSLGVPSNTYFDFETGVISDKPFTTADFFWNVTDTSSNITLVNSALARNLGIVPFNSVDGSLNLNLGTQKAYVSIGPSTNTLTNGTVFIWKTTEGNFYKMRVDSVNSILSITYSSIFYYSIDGNQNFLAKAEANGWPGNGSVSNPIVIQDLHVNTSLFGGFFLTNTNLHFVMENNYFTGYGVNIPGLVFDNVTNGVVTGNTITGYSIGTFINNQSANLEFSSNVIDTNAEQGILVEGSDSISLTKNKISTNGGSGALTYQSTDVSIDSNNFDSNSLMVVNDPSVLSAGVNFVYSTGSVTNNNMTNGKGSGAIVFGDNGLTISSNMLNFNLIEGITVIGSDSTTLSLNTVDSNSGAGVSVSSSIYTVLDNNQIANNGQDGIYWINSSFGTINSNTVTGNSNTALLSAKVGDLKQVSLYSGMWMDPSYFNTITNNDFSNNGFGVQLEASDFNTFSTNSISNNAQNGFSVINSSSNVITGNKLIGNANPTTLGYMLSNLKPGSVTQVSLYSGMWMDPSSNNTVTNNEISSNYGIGVHIYESDTNKFDSNSITGNGLTGVFVENSNSNVISNNDISGNSNPTLQSQYMQAFKPESINQVSLYSGMWMDPSSNNLVTNNKFDSNYGDGVIMSQSDNNYFTSNQITNNAMNGFAIQNSKGNNINKNTITGNANPTLLAELLASNKPGGINQVSLYSGMWMDPSTKNNVENNVISNNYGNGFWLQGSSFNALAGNKINGNAANGVFVENSNYNSITNNDISSNSNPLLQQESYLALNNAKPGSVAQVSLYSGMWMDPSIGNYVAGNTLSNNPGRGVLLQSSSKNVFDQNSITNSGMDGFLVQDSNYNNLTSNTIVNSGNTAVLNSFLAYAKPGSIAQVSLYSGMWMDPSEGNIVAYNNISNNNGFGMQSLSSSGNSIYGNEMSYNTMYGFYSVNSTENTINDNSFTFNGHYGTYFDSQSSKSNVNHNDFVSNDPGSGNKQGYDDGGNMYANNFLIDANPNLAYRFAGSSKSTDPTPSYTPSTNLSKYHFAPISVDFDVSPLRFEWFDHGRYIEARVTFPIGYSAYLVNTSTLYAEWNGHVYPAIVVRVQSTHSINIKFDRMSLLRDVFNYFRSDCFRSSPITLNFYGQFNGKFLSFHGSDTINVFRSHEHHFYR